ncbi:hypothetical protein BUE76_07745 [Cnuella takakiae]|nr:hypothetical protein BUE76_07745 [Cnuella takakiae]
MNAGKYGSVTKVSKATATRDLQALLEMGALAYLGEGGGRSTKYGLNLRQKALPAPAITCSRFKGCKQIK